MWIERTPNGFRAVERYLDPLTGKTKKTSIAIEKNTASTRKIAEKALREKIKRKTSQNFDSVTMSTLVDAWLIHQQQNVKDSTFVTYKSMAGRVLDILNPDCLTDSITARYINERVNKHYDKPSSQNCLIRYIKSILNWGYENDYVQDIAWLGKLKYRKDVQKKLTLQEKYLEKSELNHLTDSMQVQRWKDMTLFLALTGLRIGEALALEYADINLDSRYISITKTYSQAVGKIHSPKTTESIRDVYIQDELLPLCSKLKSNASRNRFISPLVFHGCKAISYSAYLRRTSRKHLGRQVSPHVLRHTHVALLAENGIPLEVISRRLGHRDAYITRDIYFHATSNLKERDNQAIKQVHII